MPAKWNPPCAEDLINAYRTGESAQALGQRYGVSAATIKSRLNEYGVPLRNSRSAKYFGRYMPPDKTLINRYLAGQSSAKIAAAYGMNYATVIRALKRNNINTRSSGESHALTIAQMTPEERKQKYSATKKGKPGHKRSFEDLCKAAKTREGKTYSFNSPYEATVRANLDTFGIDTIINQAIGQYSADLGASPVAMEIYGGNFHGSGYHRASFSKRCRYILNAGWNLVIIWCCEFFRLDGGAGDYLAAFIKQSRSDPTFIRQYRVIGGNGKELLAHSGNFDDFAFIPPGC